MSFEYSFTGITFEVLDYFKYNKDEKCIQEFDRDEFYYGIVFYVQNLDRISCS